jgi:micrococcal nuclease
VSFARKPGVGAIAVLVLGLVLLLSGGDPDERPRERERVSRDDPSTRPGSGRDDRGDPERDREGGGAPARAGVEATVTRVVDGDTVEVSLGGGFGNVRYIGVDTPESVAPGQPVECFGERASELNRDLVEGRGVRLVFDNERRDQYGRLLAYVYAGETFVNAELVRRGFARTLTISPNTDHAALFDRLEQAAGNAGRGLWGACGP